MRIDWSTLALQLVNFAILVWLLERFLYRPVLRVIDARRAAADERYADAAHAEEAAKQQLAELAVERAGVAAERATALERAQEEAGQVIAVRRAQAERDAQGLLDEARRTLAREREQALTEARHAALDLSAEMARRVLEAIPESTCVQGWLERIDAHLKGLPPADRAGLAEELVAGHALRVVTARPISAEAQAGWRARLRESFGTDAAISFDSEPRLMGGAELRFPHATLRFSVQSILETLQEEARRDAQPR
jgi:F-type H+-transporting ATPase subunit b